MLVVIFPVLRVCTVNEKEKKPDFPVHILFCDNEIAEYHINFGMKCDLLSNCMLYESGLVFIRIKVGYSNTS